MSDSQLFDPGPALPGHDDGLSPDARRTAKRRAMLAEGIHPLMGGPVNLDHTCGDCEHHFSHTRNQTWHKCDLNATRGPGTDIRVSWPACTRWEAES